MRRRHRLLLLSGAFFALALLAAASPLSRILFSHIASHWLRPELRIGALHWQLFPHPQITLNELRLLAPEDGKAFAHLEELTLTARGLALPDVAARGLALALSPKRIQSEYWLHPQPESDAPVRLPNLTLADARIDYRADEQSAPWQLVLPQLVFTAPTPGAAPSLTAYGQLLSPEQPQAAALAFHSHVLLDGELRTLRRALFTAEGALAQWQLAPAAYLLLHDMPLAADAWPEKIELSAHALREESAPRETLELSVHGSPANLDFAFQMQQADDALAAAHARLALNELTADEDGALHLPLRALHLAVPSVCARTPHQLEFADTVVRYAPETRAFQLDLRGALDAHPLRLKLAHDPHAALRWQGEGTLAALNLGDCPAAPSAPDEADSNPLAFVDFFEHLSGVSLQLAIGEFHMRGIRAHNLQVHLSP
ncbi:MAG: hypothetical protein IJS87_00830 [Rhodocyclaceae bacterium]|nr:hypothetical protein [Rhodocyclaceae bacterium]